MGRQIVQGRREGQLAQAGSGGKLEKRYQGLIKKSGREQKTSLTFGTDSWGKLREGAKGGGGVGGGGGGRGGGGREGERGKEGGGESRG